LADLVRKTVGRFKILADKKKIKLTVKTDKIILLVDKQKIKEMIGIFLDNAIKYTPQKGRVDVRLVKLRGRCRCRLQIKDSGIGIDKKDLPHVFKRFYRTDASRTRGTAGGFGLGLSLAKQIVDLHHGRIEVNSKLGEGTVFNVVF
jgi:signal transduction histidine kinase